MSEGGYASLISMGRPFSPMLPLPDASIDADDMALYAYLYVVEFVFYPVPTERSFEVEAYNRFFTVRPPIRETFRVSKTPSAVLDFGIDWSYWLQTGEVISTSIWTVASGLTKDSSSATDTTTTLWLSDGTLNGRYNCINRITTNRGRTDERMIEVRILTPLSFEADKDPQATLDYRLDWSNWLTDDDEVVSSEWIVERGLTEVRTDELEAALTILVSGGTPRGYYDLVSRITTQQGRTDERTISLRILNK